jgi:hypothetical protein
MSHKFNLGINEIVGFQVESTAEWRRLKAKQFPDDTRNLEAAEQLDRLAAEITSLDGSEIHRQIDQLYDLAYKTDDFSFSESLNESVSEELRSIGFHGTHTGASFLEWYRRNLEALLREQIDGDDSGIKSPHLDEQIENDPAVRAAKQQYEEARAREYAEARKRI